MVAQVSLRLEICLQCITFYFCVQQIVLTMPSSTKSTIEAENLVQEYQWSNKSTGIVIGWAQF